MADWNVGAIKGANWPPSGMRIRRAGRMRRFRARQLVRRKPVLFELCWAANEKVGESPSRAHAKPGSNEGSQEQIDG